MNQYNAFISEWGNNGLDFTKKKVSTHFIVSAIIITKEAIPEMQRIVHAVQKRHFKGGVIETSMIGHNHNLRKLILEDLLEAPFKIFSLIVDKRQVLGEGLRFKGSLYKFLHGMADRQLFALFPNLEMIALPLESETFMEGFVEYVKQNHIPNLFNESTFGFVKEHSVPISHTSQFIADTLAMCYDETVITSERHEFVRVLQSKILSIKFWPDIFEPNLVENVQSTNSYNVALANLSMDLANEFIKQKSNGLAAHIIDQVTTLGYLLFHFKHIDPNRYISSFEIIEHIKARRSKAVSLHYFQTKVIAPLRDAGVLIASSSKGYKLPASESDLYDFINHSNTIIEPMLSRVKKFRNQITTATNGELDILNKEEYQLIRKILD